MSMSEKAFNVNKLRTTVLDMAYAGSSVHIGCAFSIIELLAVLYRNYLGYPSNNPQAAERDCRVSGEPCGRTAAVESRPEPPT